jgi:hypothetical protein
VWGRWKLIRARIIDDMSEAEFWQAWELVAVDAWKEHERRRFRVDTVNKPR